MRIAARAEYFHAFHAVGLVAFVFYGIFAQRLEKAGPAAGARKFLIGPEKSVAANGAVIFAQPRKIPELAGKSAFRARQPRNGINIGGQNFLPFFVGYVQFFGIGAG